MHTPQGTAHSTHVDPFAAHPTDIHLTPNNNVDDIDIAVDDATDEPSDVGNTIPPQAAQLSTPPIPSGNLTPTHHALRRPAAIEFSDQIPASRSALLSPSPEHVAYWQDQRSLLIDEANARGDTQDAAPIWFDVGRITEHAFADPRTALEYYQRAHRCDKTYLPVIHAVRRIFTQYGKWSMVQKMLDEEISLAPTPPVDLLLEKARISLYAMRRPDDATLLYKRILEIDPCHADAVESLVGLLLERDQPQQALQLLDNAIRHSNDLPQRVHLRLWHARISEGTQRNLRAALSMYEALLVDEPNNSTALMTARRLYERLGDAEGMRAALDHLHIDATNAAPSERLLALLDLAHLAMQREHWDEAVIVLQEARSVAPHAPTVTAALVRALRHLQDWPQLATALDVMATNSHRPEERTACWLEAGSIADEKLQQPEQAIAYYRACLGVSSRHPTALAALGKLYARLGRLVDLADIYDLQIDAALLDDQNPTALQALLFKQAMLLANPPINDPQRSIARLEQLLQRDPTYLPALKALARQYARTRQWERLFQLYENELALTHDVDQALALLERMATLCERELSDPYQAIEAYKQMLVRAPKHLPALRSLGRLYAETQQWKDLLAINVLEIELTSDEQRVVELWFRSGEIADEQLSNWELAVSYYQKALAIRPRHVPALRALGAIYASLGRWRDLIAMHQHDARYATSTSEKIRLLLSIARIYSHHLDDYESAARIYREILSIDANHRDALRALSTLAELRHDFATSVALLRQEAHSLADSPDKALLLTSAATLLDVQMQQPEQALKLLQEALDAAPLLQNTHQNIIHMYARLGLVEKEIEAREKYALLSLSNADKAANLRALASMYAFFIGDKRNALRVASELANISNNITQDAEDLLLCLQIAIRCEHHAEAAHTTSLLAQVCKNNNDDKAHQNNKNRFFLQAAQWTELANPTDPTAVQHYLQSVQFSSDTSVSTTTSPAWRAAERLLLSTGNASVLYDLGLRELQISSHSSQWTSIHRASCEVYLGDLAEHCLGRYAAAVEHYERALEIAPTFLPAILRLKSMYRRAARVDDELRMLSLEASAARDDKAAVRQLLELATLHLEKMHDVPAAIDAYLRLLERAPLHEEAFVSVVPLLRSAGRWDELKHLHILRAEHAPDLTHRVDTLVQMAKVCIDHTQQYDEAVTYLQQVITAIPNHVDALLLLGNLQFSQQRWDDFIATANQLLPIADDATAAPINYQLGIIYTEGKFDPHRAIQSLGACLAYLPDHRDARRRLATAYALANAPTPALQTYQLLLSSAADVDERIYLHMTIAQLLENSFADYNAAAHEYEKALVLTATVSAQQQILSRIAYLFDVAGNRLGLAAVLPRQAERIAHEQPLRAAELYRDAAQLFSQGGDSTQAIHFARMAMKTVAPLLGTTSSDAVRDAHQLVLHMRGFIADVYTQQASAQHNLTAVAIDEHRSFLQEGHVRASSISALHRLWIWKREHDKAFVAADILSFLGVRDTEAEAFSAEHRKLARKESDETMSVSSSRFRLLHPAHRNPVGEMMRLAALDLGKVFTDDIAQYEIDKRDILKPRSDDALRILFNSILKNFGASDVGIELWRTRLHKNIVECVSHNTPLLVVGIDLGRTHQIREQRFLLGRKVMGLLSGHALLVGKNPRTFGVLISALGRAVDKNFPSVLGDETPEIDVLSKRISSALSRSTRRALEDPVAQLAPKRMTAAMLQSYLDAIPMTEARAGYILSNAFDAAMRLVARDRSRPLSADPTQLLVAIEADPVLADLVAFALSDDAFAIRQELRFAIDA